MGDTSLRQWLDNPQRSVNFCECLNIFRQIVEIVHVAHSQGNAVHNVRPSCFVMSSFRHASSMDPASCSDADLDTPEEDSEIKTPTLTPSCDMHQQRCLGSDDFVPAKTSIASSSSVVFVAPTSLMEDIEGKDEEVAGKKQLLAIKQELVMELSWYTSPEEVAGAVSSCASDIFQLGVLLFELFCPLSRTEEKSRTMSSLRNRVLPPQLLLKWPKEASFCLWLLHPEPIHRPTIGDLLQSEFLNKPTHDVEECEATVELRESIYNQELLLEFLLLIQKKKVEAAEKLQHSITFLCSDIAEVTKQKTEFMEISGTALASDDCSTSRFFPSTVVVDNDENSTSPRTRKRVRTDTCVDDTAECDDQKNEESRLSKSPQFLKNFKKLEHAYFSTRSKSSYSSGKVHVVEHTPVSANGRGSFVVTERSCVSKVASKEQFREGKIPWANPFLEGLQKYLSFSRLKVKADLKQGDLLHSSNLVCSVSFDRDAEFFATAGVNKKIKVFEYDSTINEDLDIQYPVVEMVSRSTLSSTCWNTYVKSQIASSNFEGVVQLWDVTTSQVQCEMREHNQRAWSIDFSSVDPTLLASASDDGSVKLWTINQGVSVGTIKTKANVCCVQFHLDFAHFLAFGSADHQIYYYDLRNMKEPLCTLVGHNRTVSYIKFVDSVSLVSASTDNTLKLWDLSNSASRVIDSPLQSFTGHKNIKNFVGLSVSDGYIATGSETNEVFIYHKAFPMPALSFKFYSSDPLPVDEANDPSNFITSVCWRGQSTTLIAANSTGNVKILQMV